MMLSILFPNNFGSNSASSSRSSIYSSTFNFARIASFLSWLHIPVFVPFFGVPESRAGFLFRPDSGGIRLQHP